jgi:hypothetical protein
MGKVIKEFGKIFRLQARSASKGCALLNGLDAIRESAISLRALSTELERK